MKLWGKENEDHLKVFIPYSNKVLFIPFFVKILNFVAKNRTSMTLKSLKQEKLQSSLVWIIEIRN